MRVAAVDSFSKNTMLNIPVKNPLVVQLITIGAGIAAVLVAYFAPNYSVLLADILRVLGIGAIGVGAAQITAKQPGDAQPVAGKDPEPTRIRFDRPDEPDETPPSAAFSWAPCVTGE
jgi:hypothetical protein